MLNKKEVKTRTSPRKYISLSVLTAAFAALVYIVPVIDDLILCALAGSACICVMAACVKFGELGDPDV